MKYFIIYANEFLILLIFVIYSIGQKEIHLVIKGKGQQNLLNKNFYLSPSEVIVNDM